MKKAMRKRTRKRVQTSRRRGDPRRRLRNDVL
jgi:hypothetical protein